MKKFIAASLALVGMVIYFATPEATAQRVSYPRDSVIEFSVNTQDQDTNNETSPTGFWVKYVGPEESGTVDLVTNAYEFHSGPLASEIAAVSGDSDDVNRSATADDVCGSARSALDVTNAACDTTGELVDVINNAQNNTDWVAVIHAIASDDTSVVALDYVDPADAQAKLPGGFGWKTEPTTLDTMALLLRPDMGLQARPNENNNGGLGDIEFFLTRVDTTNSYSQALRDNPFNGMKVELDYVVALLNGNSAWRLRIYAVRYNGSSRTERIVYQRDDTTDDTDLVLDFSRAPLVSAPGETFLIEIFDDTMVTGRIAASGRFVYVNR